MMKKQSGMTFLGFVIIAVVVITILLAGVKIAPDYIEFFSVKKVIQRIGNDSNFDSMSKKEIRDSFNKGADVSYVKVITGNDLIFTQDESGRKEVIAEYQVVKSLAFNLSALMDFKASTAD